jgi:hypothetical protein
VRFDLQVDEAHVVARIARGAGHRFEAERLQPQEHARVHQTARMDSKQSHEASLRCAGPTPHARGLPRDAARRRAVAADRRGGPYTRLLFTVVTSSALDGRASRAGE